MSRVMPPAVTDLTADLKLTRTMHTRPYGELSFTGIESGCSSSAWIDLTGTMLVRLHTHRLPSSWLPTPLSLDEVGDRPG